MMPAGGDDMDQAEIMEQADDDSQLSPAAVADASVPTESLDEPQQQQQEVALIELQLAENPAQYELHARLLRLLRSLHETDALRTARLRMADLFPLTADLWQEWLDDDKQRMDSLDDQLRLLALHQRSCRDYLVPQLWLQYVQYAEQLLYSADEQQWGDEGDDRPHSGVSRARAAYEEAVQAMGAHRLDGEKLWRGHRKLELKVLTAMLQLKEQREDERDCRAEEKAPQTEDGGVSAEEEDSEEDKQDVEQVMRQLERIKTLFRRCLALPLNGLEQAYSEYKQFVEQQGYGPEDDITRTFKQAKALRDARTPYEKALPQTDAASPPPSGVLSADDLSAWYAYIQFEQQQSAKRRPSRVAVLYERALASSFLHADMWSAYTRFLEDRDSRHEKTEERRADGEDSDDSSEAVTDLLSVYQRATRNVPHSSALWSGLIRTLEQRRSGQDELTTVYRRAMEALAARGGDELAAVCLSSADCLRRQLRVQLQRDSRSRSRSPMRSSSASTSNTSSNPSSFSTNLSLPFSRPPSKHTVITAALNTLRPIFHQAVQALRYHDPASSHPSHHSELTASVFIAYHSLERQEARDTTAAREVMEQWADMASGDSRVWVEWARAEADAGEVAYARHIYKRGLERLLLDWSAESVCWEWLRFEREHGSADEYSAAWRRCEKLLEQFNAARTTMQQQQAAATTLADGANTATQTHDVYTGHTDKASSDDSRKRRTQRSDRPDSERKEKNRSKKRNKPDSPTHSEHDNDKHAEVNAADENASSTKRRKKETGKQQRKKRGDIAAEADHKAEEEEVKADSGGAQSTETQRDDSAVVNAAQAAPSTALTAAEPTQAAVTTMEGDSHPAPTAQPEHVVPHPTRTLLVSNLSWVTTRDTLQTLFQPHGDVESVSMLADAAASHKQHAYIVYASKDAIKAAVAATHSHIVDGSTVEVECVAHRHKREKQQQKAAAHRSLTVFIKQLQPRDDAEARLRLHFAGCGSIVRVRLVRDNKTGEWRPVAWIELADKDAFDKALQLDGSVMDGDEQPIRVVPDRPPPPPRHGGSKKESEEHSASETQRNRLQLMPRVVQAHERDKRSEGERMVSEDTKGSAASDAVEMSVVNDEAATQAPPMSNNDFRAMLTRRT